MSDAGKMFGMAMAVKSAMAEEGLSTGEEVAMEIMLVTLTIAENSPHDPEEFRRGLRRFCKGLLRVQMEKMDDTSAAVVYPGKGRLQ